MADLQDVFDQLRRLLESHEPGLEWRDAYIGSQAKVKKPAYHLYGKEPVSVVGRKPEQIYFAGTVLNMNFVSLHFMPMYCHPDKFHEMDPRLKCFSYSLYFDYQLLEAEIRVDIAWAKMLARVGLITKAECSKLIHGLKSVEKSLRLKDPHAKLQDHLLKDYEDIHTLIQASLEKKVGLVGKKIHTGRSRNDLVVTSTRIYLKSKITLIESHLVELEKSLVDAA